MRSGGGDGIAVIVISYEIGSAIRRLVPWRYFFGVACGALQTSRGVDGSVPIPSPYCYTAEIFNIGEFLVGPVGERALVEHYWTIT